MPEATKPENLALELIQQWLLCNTKNDGQEVEVSAGYLAWAVQLQPIPMCRVLQEVARWVVQCTQEGD